MVINPSSISPYNVSTSTPQQYHRTSGLQNSQENHGAQVQDNVSISHQAAAALKAGEPSQASSTLSPTEAINSAGLLAKRLSNLQTGIAHGKTQEIISLLGPSVCA